MKCESCGKNNVTVHFTKIVAGKMEERHLCEECAKDENQISFVMPFSFNELFSGLIDFNTNYKEEKEEKICPKCGISYKRLITEGKFGCSVCFETFKDEISSLLRNIQGHDEHMGKIPSRSNSKIKLKKKKDELKRLLKECVANEEFEQAAVLRDKIKEIDSEIDYKNQDSLGGEE